MFWQKMISVGVFTLFFMGPMVLLFFWVFIRPHLREPRTQEDKTTE